MHRWQGFFILITMLFFGLKLPHLALAEDAENLSSYNEYVQRMPDELPLQFVERTRDAKKQWPIAKAKRPTSTENLQLLRNLRVRVSGESHETLETAIGIFDRETTRISFQHGQPHKLDSTAESWTLIVYPTSTGSECDAQLKETRDHAILMAPQLIRVCAQSAEGSASALYYLIDRFLLAGQIALPPQFKITRKSKYSHRITLSAHGSMQWPDHYLEFLARSGFTGIFASLLANADGSPGHPHYPYRRHQGPEEIQKLIHQAQRYGLKVYVQLMHEIEKDGSDHDTLRQKVRSMIDDLPGLGGLVLLNEGFSPTNRYKWNLSKYEKQIWIDTWLDAVTAVGDVVSKQQPSIKVLAWDYGIDFREANASEKAQIVTAYPNTVTPIITWVNGKTLDRGRYQGWVRDYSISETDASEVALAQMEAARSKKQPFWLRVDTVTSWQFGILPQVPSMQKWLLRYQALDAAKPQGLIENWTHGLNPTSLAQIRSFLSWSSNEKDEVVLKSVANAWFGPAVEEVLQAWQQTSDGVSELPETGPYFATNSAMALPFWLKQPKPIAAQTVDMEKNWEMRTRFTKQNKFWPYFPSWLVFIPDFSGRTDARVPFVQHLEVDHFIEGLEKSEAHLFNAFQHFQNAFKETPEQLRPFTAREILGSELAWRMLSSARRLLQFEGKRQQFMYEPSTGIAEEMLAIVNNELSSTRRAALILRKNSRLGYNSGYGYILSPMILDKKIEVLLNTITELKHILER